MKLIKYLFLFLILFSCKKVSTQNNLDITALLFTLVSCKFSSQENKSATNNVNTEQQSEGIDGDWSCINYEKDNRFLNSKFGTEYAEEFKNNFSLSIKKDSITIGSCKEELYKYKYEFEGNKSGGENVFKIKTNKQKSIKIFSTYENKSNTCFPLDNVMMYHTEKNQIIVHDKGYFFYLTRTPNATQETQCKKQGIVGNTRNYWKLECEYSKSLNETYLSYLKEFPYSSKHLLKDVPLSNYTDDENNIVYSVKENKLEINKSDPMGIIYTSFERVSDKTLMVFEMRYPEY